MTASLRCHPDSPVATPLEVDDLLDQILLRMSPLPSSLPRASLVSHRWRRLVSDPKFLRRFRLRHRRNPPLLGFFDMCFQDLRFQPTLEAPNRVPPGRFSLHFDDNSFRLASSRHGLVLVFREQRKQVLVWDPVTAGHHHIAIPPGFVGRPGFHGAVLRAAQDVRHFQAVLIMADHDDPQHRRVLACIYSSETGVWGDIISAPLPPRVPTSVRIVFVHSKPAVLVDNSLYWMLAGDLVGILEFDLERKSIALIQPPVDVFTEGKFGFTVMRAESGGLGFLFISKPDYGTSNIQLWKRKNIATWVLERTIELDKLIFLNPDYLGVAAFAEDNNVVVLYVDLDIFMIHLDSLKFKKLPVPNVVYHPFESVYAAGI
ncbi:hypothetical protein ACQ4PT_012075 [Festuca glaucescens]